MSRLLTRQSALLALPAMATMLGVGAQLARAGTVQSPATASPGTILTPAQRHRLAQIPLAFTEANEHRPSDARYVLLGRDKSFYFSRKGVTVSLATPNAKTKARLVALESAKKASRWNARLEFLNGNPQAKLQGEAPTGTKVSYFTGPRATWRSGLQSFSRLRYRQLWRGVDLAYTTTADQVKHEFVVAPGADPQQIRLAYRGVDRLRVTEGGALEVTTPGGSFEDARPIAYQEQGGKRVPVAARFVLDQLDGEAHGYHFALGQYDRRLPVVIDPSTLVYAGLLGGTGADAVNGVAVDTSGASYLIGTTNSTELSFPVTVGPDLTAPAGTNAFIAKVRPDGSDLEYCGYLGGAQADAGTGVAVDDQGNAYLGGWTESTEATFPVVNGIDGTYNGARDGFVAKISPDGTSLIYCSYLGGNQPDFVTGVAVDALRRLYVTGETGSSPPSFPVVKGPVLTGTAQAGFVARIASNGQSFEYCGYLTSGWYQRALGVAVDDLSSAYVVGYVYTGDDYPNTTDGFVMKIKPDGSGIAYQRFMYGSGADQLNAVAVRSRRAYVVGVTNSGELTIPVKGGPKLLPQGGTDALVACVAPSGASYDFCGFLGGAANDEANGVAVDAQGNVYVTGTTSSTEAFTQNPFPVKLGPDLTANGNGDAFIAKIPAGAPSQLVYSGFVGGREGDNATGVAVDTAGAAYLVGFTTSPAGSYPAPIPGDFPVKGGLPRSHQGATDGFVVKVAPNPDSRVGPDLTGAWGEVIGTAAGSGPDLRISLAGQFRVQSVGTTSANASTLRLLLSTDATPSTEDLVVAYEAVPALAVGSNHLVSFNTELPSGVTDIQGRYLLGVVDYTNAVDEINDDNNLVPLGPLMPRPDLTGTWGAVTQSSTGSGANQQFTLQGNFQVRNIGAAPAGRYTLRLLFSTDAVASANDIVVQYVGLPALPQGGTQTVQYQVTLPKGVAVQGRYLIGIVDYAKAVDERDEGNNTLLNGPLP